MRSGAIGAIGNNGTTYLMASVKKAGTVSFWWKAQCEEPVPYSWPRQYNLGVARRLYKVYGSETLENGGEWQYPTNSLHRFFKVMVEMPQNSGAK